MYHHSTSSCMWLLTRLLISTWCLRVGCSEIIYDICLLFVTKYVFLCERSYLGIEKRHQPTRNVYWYVGNILFWWITLRYLRNFSYRITDARHTRSDEVGCKYVRWLVVVFSSLNFWQTSIKPVTPPTPKPLRTTVPAVPSKRWCHRSACTNLGASSLKLEERGDQKESHELFAVLVSPWASALSYRDSSVQVRPNVFPEKLYYEALWLFSKRLI